jgi:hypothetical protein
MWNSEAIGVLVRAIPAARREGKNNADGPAPAAAPEKPKEGGHAGH